MGTYCALCRLSHIANLGVVDCEEFIGTYRSTPVVDGVANMEVGSCAIIKNFPRDLASPLWVYQESAVDTLEGYSNIRTFSQRKRVLMAC